MTDMLSPRRYTVRGRWPFPTDMLRHDQAAAATDEDAEIIDKLTRPTCPTDLDREVTVALVMEGGEPSSVFPNGRYRPNEARWMSFGWIVTGVEGLQPWEAVEATSGPADVTDEPPCDGTDYNDGWDPEWDERETEL